MATNPVPTQCNPARPNQITFVDNSHRLSGEDLCALVKRCTEIEAMCTIQGSENCNTAGGLVVVDNGIGLGGPTTTGPVTTTEHTGELCDGRKTASGTKCSCVANCQICSWTQTEGSAASHCRACKNSKYLQGGNCVAQNKCKRLGGVPAGAAKVGRMCTMPSSQGTDTDCKGGSLYGYTAPQANTKGHWKKDGVKGVSEVINGNTVEDCARSGVAAGAPAVSYKATTKTCWVLTAVGVTGKLAANQRSTNGWTLYMRVAGQGCRAEGNATACPPLQKFATARANTRGRIGQKVNGVYLGRVGVISRLGDAEACATECLNEKDCVAFSVKVHCWLFNTYGGKEPLPNKPTTQGWTTYTRIANDKCRV